MKRYHFFTPFQFRSLTKNKHNFQKYKTLTFVASVLHIQFDLISLFGNVTFLLRYIVIIVLKQS